MRNAERARTVTPNVRRECARSHAYTEQDITERIRTPLYRKLSELSECVPTRKVGAA